MLTDAAAEEAPVATTAGVEAAPEAPALLGHTVLRAIDQLDSIRRGRHARGAR